MLSKINRRIKLISKTVAVQPLLFQLRQQGGLPKIYNKLNMDWFRSLGIDTVLDIGANTGQFTKTISALLPDAKIYAFEPLPDCFEQLQKFVDRHSNIKAFNIGIGEQFGILSFERNESSQSSSFLKMTDTHKLAFPFTERSSTVEVKIAKLDDVVKNINLGESIAIKIDVQGYEDKVLRGGKETVQKAKIVIVEVSFVHLYESQPLFGDIYNIFSEWGFSCFGTIDQLADPRTGQILQGDAIFMK